VKFVCINAHDTIYRLTDRQAVNSLQSHNMITVTSCIEYILPTDWISALTPKFYEKNPFSLEGFNIID